MPDVTETQLYAAWRALESVSRGGGDSTPQRAEMVAPAMAILEAVLGDLGFTIVDRELVPVPAEEEGFTRGGRISTLPAEPEIDNTLPPETGEEKPPPGTDPPLEPQAEQQSSKRWRK